MTDSQPIIATASWFAKLPATHLRVGISRGTPRGQAAGFKQYRALCPGSWFKSCTPAEYLRRFNKEILASLDPHKVVADLQRLASDGRTPTLLCFEGASDVQCGVKWCHRHIVAQWLEDSLGIKVPEVDFPGLDRFALLRLNGVAAPSYSPVEPPAKPTGKQMRLDLHGG
jgi:hypothetical protein